MAKTASFGVLHLGTSFGVTYTLTGNIAIAGAVTFIEPLVNTVMHHFFEKYWGHPALLAWWARRGRPSEVVNPA
ncbi:MULTISPECIES: DUF2061 domain-containing protein [Roseateles]|uniref:DUF2061 domain-containing protein n=1 Tax=Roseateles albus TaxID=2987525 RepID=A0ABT5KE18_9BURK|nr:MULTISPECIES: DUF2061 domain-containing protein [Roseateles]MCV2358508.1 DUF2061 domain-containing protein [Paucibacter sp. TC2R-5]MDC8772161.1 DUF2061 domain-containing protein [Roseateles albus]